MATNETLKGKFRKTSTHKNNVDKARGYKVKMNKIHIMHVIYSLGIGGAENILINLINEINQDIFISSICCIEKSGILATRIKRKDIKIFECYRGKGDYLLPLKLYKLFKKERVDVVHTYGWSGFDGIVAAKLAGIPLIIHTEVGRDIGEINNLKRRKILGRRLISSLVNHLVTVSEELKDSLIKTSKISPDKIICIHPGVSLEEFEFPIDKNKNKKGIGFKEDTIVIGSVGRLDPIKNYPNLIYAAREIINEYPDIRFVLVGDGPLKNKLESIIKELDLEGKVILLGRVDNVLPFLKIMDIFVLPSFSEGLSVSILESMACGLPIVATNVGGNPEIVLDGVTGILVPPENCSTLAMAIMKLIKNPEIAKEMGIAGQKRIKTEFSFSKMINSYEKLYKEVI